MLLFALFLGISFATHVETARFCLQDNPRKDSKCGGCTANDVSFAEVRLVGDARSCTVGETINVTVNALWASTTADERYQVQVYIAMDGGDASTGTCYPYYLHGPTPAATNGVSTAVNNDLVIGSPDSAANDGPFPDFDGDKCGDIGKDMKIWQTIRDVQFICRDTNDDGTADFQYCMGWANNRNKAGCDSIETTLCQTSSKCNCGDINIQGLTVCSTQQLQCHGDGAVASDPKINEAPCEPVWSAGVKITSSATSEVFPPLSVLYANAYLDFETNDQVLALEYFDQALAPGQKNVVREELLFPCKASTYNYCGGQCTAIFSKNLIPRIFHEGSYSVDVMAGLLHPDVAVACPTVTGISNTGFTCFRKTISQTPVPGNAIDFIWAKEVSSRWEVHVARSVDGTVWEFFLENLSTRGTYLADPIAATSPPEWQNPKQIPITDPVTTYNVRKFDSTAGCAGANPPCGADVDVVFVADQKHPTLDGFTLGQQTLILNTIQANKFSSGGSRFGVGYSGGNGKSPQFVATALAGNISASVKAYGRDPNLGGTLDYAALIQATLAQYWCNGNVAQCAAPATSANPRRLVVFVYGADTHSGSPSWQAVWDLYALLQVDVHVIGVAAGAEPATEALRLNIVNGNSARITTWLFEPTVTGDSLYLYRRLCPLNTPLCDCGGFCSCTNTDFECACPANCTSIDVCNPAECVNPSLGCQVNPDKAVICTPPDACTLSSCADVGGVATCVETPKVCTTNNLCYDPICDLSDGCGVQNKTQLPALCDLNEPCFVYGCDPALNGGRGGCTATPIPYSVLNPQCGTNPCLLTGADYPCAQGTPCNPVTCIQSVSQCSLVPTVNQTACQARFDTSNPASPGFYCSFEQVDCSGRNDACNTFSCNAADGECVVTSQTTCTAPGKCSVGECVLPGGCEYTPLADVSSVCPPRFCETVECVGDECVYANSTALSCKCEIQGCAPDNACTTTTCIDSTDECNSIIPSGSDRTDCLNAMLAQNQYCYVVQKACPTNTNCSTYACNPTTGNCDATPVTCDDGNKCTVSSCATGFCVHTPLNQAQLDSVCPPITCQSASCPVGAGDCAYVVNSTLCAACDVVKPTIPAATFCQQFTCVDEKTPVQCADLASQADRDACAANLTLANVNDRFYVGALTLDPGPCNSSDACTQFTCNNVDSRCDVQTTMCSPPDACQTAVCDPSQNGCVYTPLTVGELNALCPPQQCKIPSCTGGQCVYADDPSLECACERGTPCNMQVPDTFCTQTLCINVLSGAGVTCDLTTGNATQLAACQAAVNANNSYCFTRPRPNVCPRGDNCTMYTCVNNAANPTMGSCQVTNAIDTCPQSTNQCMKPSCDPQSGCGFVAKEPSVRQSICNDNNPCTSDECNVGNGMCEYTNLTTPECQQCPSSLCAGSTPCRPIRCYKDCSDPTVLNATACSAAVVSSGTYCEPQPVTCQPNDACNVWTCNAVSGICQSSAAVNCNTGNNCTIGTCSVAAGGCIYSDPCLGLSFGANPCQEPLCVENSTAASGFSCFSASSPVRNCTDYVCLADGVDGETLRGADAQQFLTQFASQNARCSPIACTQDSCDPNRPEGCVNQNLQCSSDPAAPCNASLGCYEVGNVYNYAPGVCQETVVTSLFDFCGVCLGSNVDCFFSSVNGAGTAAGIAGGVVAGIVVAAVIAALLIAFFSKKGYDYYQAQGALQSTGLNNNPAFQESNLQGTTKW